MRIATLLTFVLLSAIAPRAFAYDAVDVALEKLTQEDVKYLKEIKSGGGAGPKGFDCSGLTHFAYSYVGVKLPKGTALQSEEGDPITESLDDIGKLQRGDLLFFANTDKDFQDRTIGHVGIHIANGLFVHIEEKRGMRTDDISVANLFYREHFLEARRLKTAAGPSTTFVADQRIIAVESEVNVRGLDADGRVGNWLGNVLNSGFTGKTTKDVNGTVLNERPVFLNDNWYWRVDFDSGADGWVAESFLARPGPPSEPPSPTVSTASCTAPIVGQAMTCSVIGTNLPSTVSVTASNCGPSPMTAVAGGSGDRRQFSCTPVTAGELVQVSYLVPGFIGPLPPIAASLATLPPSGPQVVTFEARGTVYQTVDPNNILLSQLSSSYQVGTAVTAIYSFSPDSPDLDPLIQGFGRYAAVRSLTVTIGTNAPIVFGPLQINSISVSSIRMGSTYDLYGVNVFNQLALGWGYELTIISHSLPGFILSEALPTSPPDFSSFVSSPVNFKYQPITFCVTAGECGTMFATIDSLTRR